MSPTVAPVPLEILDRLAPALNRLGTAILRLDDDTVTRLGLDEAYEEAVSVSVALTEHTTRVLDRVAELGRTESILGQPPAGDDDVVVPFRTRPHPIHPTIQGPA